MSDILNAHLLEAQDGDEEVAIILHGLDGFTISAGGSGRVPPGIYELDVIKLAPQKKKDKQGKNIRVEFRTAGPSKYAGVAIILNSPAPVGEPNKGDDVFDTGMRHMDGFFMSVHSNLGTTAEEMKKKGNTAKINGKWAKGKKCYAVLKDNEDSKGTVRSEIDRFAYKDEYEKAPGPVGGIDTAPQGGRRQTSAPEIDKLNGGAQPPTSPKAAAAVDDALGLG